jgi:hypothetical protein
VVDKAVVLSRIEDLKKPTCRITLVRNTQLVDLIEEKDRILGARLLHSFDDSARHRPDIGAPVTPDVRLVTSAPQRDSHVLPPHGTGNRPRDRGLADSGRPGKEKDWRPRRSVVLVPRSLGLLPPRFGLRLPRLLFQVALRLCRPQLVNRKELQHPVFDVLQAVVILVENLGRLLEIEMILTPFIPRQLGHGLEVAANDLVFHRLAIHTAQPAQLAVDLLARFRG